MSDSGSDTDSDDEKEDYFKDGIVMVQDDGFCLPSWQPRKLVLMTKRGTGGFHKMAIFKPDQMVSTLVGETGALREWDLFGLNVTQDRETQEITIKDYIQGKEQVTELKCSVQSLENHDPTQSAEKTDEAIKDLAEEWNMFMAVAICDAEPSTELEAVKAGTSGGTKPGTEYGSTEYAQVSQDDQEAQQIEGIVYACVIHCKDDDGDGDVNHKDSSEFRVMCEAHDEVGAADGSDLKEEKFKGKCMSMGKQLPAFAASNPPKPGEERHSLTLPDTKKYAYFVIFDAEESVSVFCVRVKKCSFGLANKFTNEVMDKFIAQFPTTDDRIGCEKQETQNAFVGDLKSMMQTFNARYIKKKLLKDSMNKEVIRAQRNMVKAKLNAMQRDKVAVTISEQATELKASAEEFKDAAGCLKWLWCWEDCKWTIALICIVVLCIVGVIVYLKMQK